MHVGAFGNKPRVPLEFFKQTARRLLYDSGCKIILTGDDENDKSVQQLMASLASERVLNLSGALNLAELGQLLLRANAFLSRDTGPAHLSAALGCPTLTIFMQPSPTMSSKRWKPLGDSVYIIEKELKQRWYEGDHSFARRHMKKINVDEIYSLLRRAMAL